jgi:hypothetical protein
MIDFTITACVEYYELKGLIYYLKYFIRESDNIIVFLDKNNTNQDMIDMVVSSGVVLRFNAESNYQKRYEYERSQCHNPIIFSFCADELPTIPLLQQGMKIFTNSPQFDAIAVPRINMFTDLTKEKANQMYVGNRGQGYLLKEPINEHGWHHWPDYQIRIIRNLPHIIHGPYTHSNIVGYKNLGHFPADPQFAMFHIKSVEHQERILKVYDKIGLG